GTRVGPWRLGHLLGRGAFGTVYRAEGVERGAKGPAALKLAHAPNDERFAREVTLLSRLRHPCIPRFLGHGQWQSPAGLLYPFVAMEVVDGTPLYTWAQATHPSSRQVLKLFAGLARALEAVHSAGGVHRDLKGGNILVRRKDGRGFLVDFGSCSYEGASSLTWNPLPPGTLSYRAPEALAHSHHLLTERGPLTSYSPRPADDLFALGVTAWRLVVGTYPPTYPPLQSPSGVLDEPGPRPAHELNARCSVELSGLIARMLSVRPEARGTAGELAEALERAARRAGPAADAPLLPKEAPSPEAEEDVPVPAAHWTHHRGLSWLAAAGLASALGVAAVYTLKMRGEEEAARAQAAAGLEKPDAGTVGVGDAVLTAPVATPQAPSTWSGIGLDLPARPFPGQTRPDANGYCPDRMQVAINGGCWWKLEGESKKCSGQTFAYRGKCYLPAFAPERLPTSSPSDAPDGGAR
ncbi:MAG TPA: serine/threonine-protein kinase, partial [Myxococcus sp.]|nr:serine/threonine-protein kinase [Myxococcus sp.]